MTQGPTNREYEQTVNDELKALAKWLDRNAEDLAKMFSHGCQNWSVEFESDYGVYGDCVPRIHIRTDKVDKQTVEIAWRHGPEE